MICKTCGKSLTPVYNASQGYRLTGWRCYPCLYRPEVGHEGQAKGLQEEGREAEGAKQALGSKGATTR